MSAVPIVLTDEHQECQRMQAEDAAAAAGPLGLLPQRTGNCDSSASSAR